MTLSVKVHPATCLDTFRVKTTNSKLSLIDQWQFCKGSTLPKVFGKIVIDRSMTFSVKVHPRTDLETFQNCHWSINDTFLKVHPRTDLDPFQYCHWSINDTFVKVHPRTDHETFQNCHWSINDNLKIVIDRSMTVSVKVHPRTDLETFQNCHWSMTRLKNVFDRSMTIWKLSLIDQWQFL